ncbi:hypothetical protein AK812_SmicGene19646 [Symbiodinium microadriaticum]|uniref:Uncharacterized protein n=1 Tax=Symbiodinium microadriaticum TaxID=2951 RepID=A0A1Q9DS12_SYMMI|nr:hypothetical protein AK812_SmicGene19646 [Symbiodinium microadriaticum]
MATLSLWFQMGTHRALRMSCALKVETLGRLSAEEVATVKTLIERMEELTTFVGRLSFPELPAALPREPNLDALLARDVWHHLCVELINAEAPWGDGCFSLGGRAWKKTWEAERASFYFGSNVGIAADDEVTAFMSHDEQRRQQEPVANAMAGTSSAPDRPALTSQCEEDSAVEDGSASN